LQYGTQCEHGVGQDVRDTAPNADAGTGARRPLKPRRDRGGCGELLGRDGRGELLERDGRGAGEPPVDDAASASKRSTSARIARSSATRRVRVN